LRFSNWYWIYFGIQLLVLILIIPLAVKNLAFYGVSIISRIVLIMFLISITVGWFFYYLSFPYWKRRDYWDAVTWIGFITMTKHITRMKEPGKTYAKLAASILSITSLIFLLTLILI
jgi:hypothetical protein